jgi:hypothetical protein
MLDETVNQSDESQNETETKKQELIETLTIERIAEILYYYLYVPDEHPKADLYKKIEDWLQAEMPELNFLSGLEMMLLLSKKLEKIDNHKHIFFRNWVDYVSSPYYDNRVPPSIDNWYYNAYYQLSQNSNVQLRPFPLNDWYQVKGSYKGIIVPKLHNKHSKWYHG